MMPAGAIVALSALISAAVAGLVCRALARAGRRGLALGLVAALAVAGFWLWLSARGAQGFDAIAAFLPVPMVLAPAALGGLVGIALGGRGRGDG
jgi:hypothetical protein